jgi:CO/xanthine dehydrogenase FAD-binding subunit
MSDMQFSTPASIDDAVSLLVADGDATILAGGTDLMVQLQSGMRTTGHVVDIKRIAELNEVTQAADGSWTLGAAVCSAELNENVNLKTQWPGVLEAADLIGSMQVQGRATLAGNLCNASPAADSVPALVAANASVTIAGPNGRRTAPVNGIATGPGQTTLEKGELIISINLPPKPLRSGEAYLRFIPRSEMDIAVVGASVFVVLDEAGICIAARASLGAVAPTVLMFDEADGILVGAKPDEQAIEKAAGILMAACRPIDDKRGTAEYRTDIAGVLFKRAAKIALERAVA